MTDIADLVHQTTTTAGTGPRTLAVVNGKVRFTTAFGTGPFYYFDQHRTQPEYEWGIGHIDDDGRLVADTVLGSSNGGDPENFTAGTRDVTNDLPASEQVSLTYLAANYLALAGGTMSGPIAMGGSKVTGLAAATAAGDAVRYEQVLPSVFQPLDADLTTIGGLTPSNDDVLQRKAGAWANRTIAQLLADLAAPGTTFQPLDSDLTTIAGLTATTDNFLQAKSSAWASRTPAQAMADLLAASGSAAGILAQLLTVDGSGSGLDADTLDGKNTGTSGNAVPLLDGANTFSAQQTITLSAGDAVPLIIRGNAAGSATGPWIDLYRDRNSLAAQWDIGIRARSKSDNGTARTWWEIRTYLDDVANGTEDIKHELYTIVAGTLARRHYTAAGFVVGAPTGGDKGTGTINAVGVYDDDTLLTDVIDEYRRTGTVDVEAWDATVPDRTIPAVIELARDVPVMDVVETVELERTEDGFVARKKTIQQQRTQLVGVWDEKGNGIAAVEAPVTERVPERIVEPERIEKRQHRAARAFKTMIDAGFRPEDPRAFINEMRRLKTLPGLPSLADDNPFGRHDHGAFSMGELDTMERLAMECLGLAFGTLVEQHEALTTRVAALEATRR